MPASTVTPSNTTPPHRVHAPWILRWLVTLAVTLLGCREFGTPAQAAAPWGLPLMQPGIAAVSCAAPISLPLSNAWVFGVMDFRTPPSAMYGPFGTLAPLWNPPGYHHPSWTAETIGNVYGITIDATGNMYLAAHGLYNKPYGYHQRYGNLGGGATNLAAAGTIYRINNTNGTPTVFATLPQQSMNLGGGFNSGPGLGNVSYDSVNNQFFATNLEDGKIYRINSSGTVVQVFDPLTADSGAAGLPPNSELLWGIEAKGTAVFYAVANVGSTTNPGKIRRVNLDGAGAMVPSTDVEILAVPASTVCCGAVYVPVSDITFSADGTRMILGERTMMTPTEAYNHASRIHIAQLSGITWTVTRSLETGYSWGHGEAYGGVALGYEGGTPEQIVWGTSADTATGAGPHGVFGVRPADFPPASSPTIVTNAFRVPFDPSYNATFGPDYKGSGGDIEIMQDHQPCAEITIGRVTCPDKKDGPFQVTLGIKNLSGVTVTYGWLTPCPTNQLSGGAVTTQPLPASVFPLPVALTNNASGSLTIQLPGSFGGQTVCFRLTLLNNSGEVCCTEKICIPLPDCDCAQLVDKKVSCKLLADGTVEYTIQLVVQNLTHLSPTPFPFFHGTFLPPTGFVPANVIPSPNPILPGATGTFTATYYGAPGPLCFNLVLHDENIDPCCVLPNICLDLPVCDPAGGKPDTCSLEERVPCRPLDGSTSVGTATVNYTICNNSSVPRTYTWSAAGLPATPPCTQVLAATDFSPASGTTPVVPPGGCITIPITIRCRDYKPDDCARFRICASSGPNVPSLCCDGTVYRPKAGTPLIIPGPDASKLIPTLAVGTPTTLAFEVINPESRALEATVTFRDEFNILTFAAEGADRGQPLYTATLALPARATRTLRLAVTRQDQGNNPPPFTSVFAWARAEKLPTSTFFTSEPDLMTGVRLSPTSSTTKPVLGPTIHSFRIQAGQPPQAVLRINSVAGQRYRVERSPRLSDGWSAAPGSVLETSTDPQGTFVGTGEHVTCVVPCDHPETLMFFRIVLID